MKKLIFAMAVAAAAGMAHAASINWGTGTAVKGIASETDSSFGSVNAAAGTLNLYVWLVDATTYSSTDIGSIWNSYGSSLGTATASVTGKAGAAGATAKTDDLTYTANQDNPFYALVIVGLDTDKDGSLDYYIANKAEGNVNGSGSGGTITGLAKFQGGGTNGTAITGWTSTAAIPEPTSGLLMLVGLAGLALRRRRA